LSSYETPESTADQAKDKAQQAAGAAQEKAQEAAGKVSDRVREQVDTRSTQAGEQAGTAAQDIRSVSEHLRSEGKDRPAQLADKAAERVEQAGDYLKRADGDAILRDVERVSRERPWAVMAGGIVLGIAASRFLKASSSRRYHEMESSSNLPARQADVAPGAIGAGATPPMPPQRPAPAAPPTPGVTTPVPGAPDRELSLTGGVMPTRPPAGPGTAGE
jgi:hypothetical protein